MTEDELEDIMDDLREIHATYCPDWDGSISCECSILEVMHKLYSVYKSNTKDLEKINDG